MWMLTSLGRAIRWLTTKVRVKRTQIRSRDGVLHFQRWRILETRWGNLYLHNVCMSDLDGAPHDHPWDFKSFIFKGRAVENVVELDKRVGDEFWTDAFVRMPFQCYARKAETFHQLTVVEPLWTIVWTGPRRRDWGYLVENDLWLQHDEYRKCHTALKAAQIGSIT